MNNIILIGFMGCGKTSVGKKLAKQLGYLFQDTDEMIVEQERKSISNIFQENGESYFRDTEEKLLETMVGMVHQTVLATGGGMPLRDKNQRLLRELGFVVYLRATKETTILRVQNDTSRPLLQGDNLSLKIDELLLKRRPIYEKCAHTIIDTDGLDFDTIIEKIIDAQRSGEKL